MLYDYYTTLKPFFFQSRTEKEKFQLSLKLFFFSQILDKQIFDFVPFLKVGIGGKGKPLEAAFRP